MQETQGPSPESEEVGKVAHLRVLAFGRWGQEHQEAKVIHSYIDTCPIQGQARLHRALS